MYSRYVSLGQNCEVAFQFRRIFGSESSSFFSWNVTNFNAATQLINNDFAGILIDSNLQVESDTDMILDKSYNYYFHSPLPTSHSLDEDEFKSKMETHREKAHYLINKFRESYNSSDLIAYFYVTNEPDCKDPALALRDALLSKHKNRNFTLVILQDESRREEPWEEECIANHYLKRLAPVQDASDGHVSSYDKVFRQYPFNGVVYYSGY